MTDEEYEIYEKYEKEYKPPKFTDKELLEIFPEAKEIIPIKIKEIKEEIQEKKSVIESRLKKLYSLKTDEISEFFGEKLIEMFFIPELNVLEKRCFRLNRFQQLLKPKTKRSKWFNFSEKIETAKSNSIEEIARDKLELKKVGGNFVCLCPFHEERTPSFYLYPETNRFYCFGCQAKGDIIDLTKELYCLDFKEAVEFLQNK